MNLFTSTLNQQAILPDRIVEVEDGDTLLTYVMYIDREKVDWGTSPEVQDCWRILRIERRKDAHGVVTTILGYPEGSMFSKFCAGKYDAYDYQPAFNI